MIDRRNRTLWAVLALLLLAGGVAGLLAGWGWLPGVSRSSALLPAGWEQTVAGWNRWAVLAGVALLGLLLALLGLWLLMTQLRRGGGRSDFADLVVPASASIRRGEEARAAANGNRNHDGGAWRASETAPSGARAWSVDRGGDGEAAGRPMPGGKTVTRGPVIARAVQKDLRRLPGVSGALVGLYGEPREAELRTQLDVAGDLPVEEVRDSVQGAIDRFVTTTGIDPADVDVTLRLLPAEPVPRVR